MNQSKIAFLTRMVKHTKFELGFVKQRKSVPPTPSGYVTAYALLLAHSVVGYSLG